MKPFLFIFIGGGIGSYLRYLLSRTFNDTFQHFYLGTFLVNVCGCLLIGMIMGFFNRGNYLTHNHLLLLVSGFCGGFTTFSAFALEKHDILKAGEFGYFFLYTLSSISAGILAVLLGLWFSRWL